MMDMTFIPGYQKCSFCEYGAVYATRETKDVTPVDGEWKVFASGAATYYCERHRREKLVSDEAGDLQKRQ